MSTKFFTNDGENTLLKRFEGVFTHNKDIKLFDALVGYFRSSGYFTLRPYLENLDKIRILVGINVDSIVEKYHSAGLLFKSEPNKAISEFLNEFKSDIQNIEYSKKVEDGIIQFVDDIISGKLELKAHPHRNLHAKIYIFKPDNFNEYKSGEVITGSSNLTDAGLGTNEVSNYEFNVALRDYSDVKFASEEFDKLWHESVPILPVDLKKAKSETFLDGELTPYELYIKFLIEFFGKSVEFDPNSIDLPKGFKRLSYQIDAVNEGFNLLQKHNGFFLADVVGLGKTVIATLIAKKFFYQTQAIKNHTPKILIIVPPALKGGWKETLEHFRLPNYQIVTNGSLHKVKNPQYYDLVLVDEAHKFRNSTADSYDQLQKICKTKAEYAKGEKADKKVILISATPLNNRPIDIANLIYLFQDAKDSTLEISNLHSFFAQCEKEYKEARREKDLSVVQHKVKTIYERIREKIIKSLTVRRTRTDLLEHDLYSKDLIEQGVRFPVVNKPEKLFYLLDHELDVLYDDTINLLKSDDYGIKYYRYQAISFLKPDLKEKLYTQADMASNQLKKIMKTLLLKRLDSSFYAFKQSLTRFRDNTSAMVTMFENNRIYVAPKLNVSEFILDDNEDTLIELYSTQDHDNPDIHFYRADDFEPEFIQGLLKDFEILNELVDRWNPVESDPKWEVFYDNLKKTFLNREHNPEQKLVIFSESKDTTTYLLDKLKNCGYDKTIGVNSENRNRVMSTLKSNFDANISQLGKLNDYDIVVTTEVLAEGVNLHRSNIIVNYDTPWNSTRLMQRIGRVNRIGSTAPSVHVYNFFPTSKVEKDLDLKKRAIMKLQAFHTALGEDSQVYSTVEEVDNFGLFDQNIEEDKDEKLSYLMELRKFKSENPAAYMRLKNKPLRSRVGRKKVTQNGSTISFIRNRYRDAFYYVDKTNQLQEISFLQAATELHAVPPEKAVPLHDKHHEQVSVAIDYFKEQLHEELKSRHTVKRKMSTAESQSVTFINTFFRSDLLSNEDKELCKSAVESIKLGRFQNLPRKVKKLRDRANKVQMELSEITVELIAILKEYSLAVDEQDNDKAVMRRSHHLSPNIIISESFSN